MLLSDSILNIKNIGEQRANKLKKLNILTVKDLIEYFPREYDDRSNVKKINEVSINEINTIKGFVVSKPETLSVKHLQITKTRINDGTGIIEVLWFNQPYLKNTLKVKSEYILTGKVIEKFGRLQLESPDFELLDDKELLNNGRIVPVYASTYKFSQKLFRSLIKDTLDLEDIKNQITDFLPEKIKKESDLCSRQFAIENIHFPESNQAFFKARTRLVFEELFLLQMRLMQLKQNIKKVETNISFRDLSTEIILNSLPFKLTTAQDKVLNEIISDLKTNFSMNRLVQGDVGSGKTAIAMAAAFICVNNGYQAALMAPTDVLATQHYVSFLDIFEPLGIKCVLLSGSQRKKEKNLIYEQIKTGEANIIIGTHAIIQDAVDFNNLGLAITDEQHRFGVNQRSLLASKSINPHVLVMSATPIPRTLALILYGDLDISIIDQLPPGRQKNRHHFGKFKLS